jgi:hypothetical protein
MSEEEGESIQLSEGIQEETELLQTEENQESYFPPKKPSYSWDSSQVSFFLYNQQMMREL